MPRMAQSAAVQAALKLLSMRARSRRELARLLERRGFSRDDVTDAVAHLAELGYLDDRALAAARAQTLLAGRFGERAVLTRLTAAGISREDAEAALLTLTAEQGFDLRASAQRLLLARKVDLGDERGRARAARLLATRGFSSDLIAALTGVETLDPPADPE